MRIWRKWRNHFLETWIQGRKWEEVWLVDWHHKRKFKYGRGHHRHNSIPSKKNHLHYFVVVVHQIPAGVCQIQQNPSVLGENSSASAFTFPWGSIIGCNLMLSIRLSLKSRGMWGKFYQAQGEWTTSPHSTVIVDQNWNAPLFNSTFCQNCTNFEAWLLTITFARKFDRLIIKGVWKIILEIWNSSQNMATSLLWARFSCHFVNVMPVFEETTWERCEKAETQMTPFYRINPRWMGIFQSLGEGVVPQGGFSRVNRSQLRPPRPGPWSTNGPPIMVHWSIWLGKGWFRE